MEVPRLWRLKAQRYRLEGSVCPTCGQRSFPPRPVCPHCAARPANVTGYVLTGIPISSRILESVPSKGG